jgi:hypothetical protein
MKIAPYEKDYLKYYVIVRKYIVYKYELTFPMFDALMYLDSEKLFTYSQFEFFQRTLGVYGLKFNDLLKRGIIVLFNKEYGGQNYTRATYTLSKEYRLIVREAYRLSRGEIDYRDNMRKTYYTTEKAYTKYNKTCRRVKKLNLRTDELRKQLLHHALL